MKAILVLAALALVAAPALADTHATKARDKGRASAGSSAPTPDAKDATDARSGVDLGQAFLTADIDGDGKVSKAEAAGNERLVVGFDRADKDRDGKLTRQEFDSVYRAKPRKGAVAAR